MSERALKRLVGALAVVFALWLVAYLVTRGGGSIDAPSDVAAAFDGVDETSVTAIRFIHPSDTIELRREGDGWRVNGFRADSGSVARFFEAASDAEATDLVASNPANHVRMGVAGDSVNSVEIEIGGDTRTILVGDAGPRVATAYARVPDEDEVYLLEGGLRAHVVRPLDDWRNRRMLAIDTSEVSRIAVQRNEDDYAVVRGDSTWTFEDGSPVAERGVENLLQQLGGALVAAGFVADGDSLAALPQSGTTTAYSEAGDVLAEVTVGSGAGELWAMAAGDSVRYRIATFRADLIAPPLERMQPE
ncbi:MAG: DUF4340 domain-containing protein [Gemmatimonadota bacterium]|jgi:hypothetical protein